MTKSGIYLAAMQPQSLVWLLLRASRPMRFFPKELLWAILFTQFLFIVALWPSNFPYSQPATIESQDRASASDNERIGQGPNSQGQHARDNASEFTIYGIKPGELLLSVVTLLLWGATVGLVKSAEKTSERQLRAYVIVEGVEMDLTGIPTATINWINSGQTPAAEVVVWSGYRLREYPPTDVFWERTVKNLKSSKTFIGAQGKIKSQVRGTRELTQEERDGISGGSHVIFIVGGIQYRDIFNITRIGRFRYAVGGQYGMLRNDRMTPCEDGNHYD